MIRYIVIFIAFITGCDYGHPKTQLLQVEFLGGYSPYDFENSIEGRYLIKLDKKKLLEDILIKLGRDHKLNDAESAFLDSAADIKGEFSSSVKESQYTTKFLFFVLSVDFGDETAIQPNAIGLYFNEKSQIIAINCPPTEEIICSELSYPKSRGWIWRYGNQHKEIKGDASLFQLTNVHSSPCQGLPDMFSLTSLTILPNVVTVVRMCSFPMRINSSTLNG